MFMPFIHFGMSVYASGITNVKDDSIHTFYENNVDGSDSLETQSYSGSITDSLFFPCSPSKINGEGIHARKWYLSEPVSDTWYYFVAEPFAVLEIGTGNPVSGNILPGSGFELLGPFNDATEVCKIVNQEASFPPLVLGLVRNTTIYSFQFKLSGIYLIYTGKKPDFPLSMSYRAPRGIAISPSSAETSQSFPIISKSNLDKTNNNSSFLGLPVKQREHEQLGNVVNPLDSRTHKKRITARNDTIEAAIQKNKSHFEVKLKEDNEDLRIRYEYAIQHFPKLEKYRKKNFRVRIMLGMNDGYVDLWSASELLIKYGRAIGPENMSDDLPDPDIRFELTPAGTIKEQSNR
jgi:hypothetical protein